MSRLSQRPWLFTSRQSLDALLIVADLLLGWLGSLSLLLTDTGKSESDVSEVSGELELLDCESVFSWHCCVLLNQNVPRL